MINFNILKSGFIEYLEKLNLGKSEHEKYDTENINRSIFLYADEFEAYIDSKNINNKDTLLNIEDLVSSEMFNDLLEEINSNKEKSSNSENSIKTNEATETKDAETEEDNLLLGIIGELFNDEEFKSFVDTDKDEKISENELLNLLNTINANDEDEENMSLLDIVATSIAYKKNELELQEITSTNNTSDTNDKENKTENTTQTNTVNKVYNNKHNISTGTTSTTKTDSKSIDEMNSDELKVEIENKEKTLKTKQSELVKIQDGATKELNNLKAQAKESFEAYLIQLEALEPQKAEELKKLTENKEKFNNNNNLISNHKATIAQCDITITNADLRISILNDRKEELENEKNNDNADIIENSIQSIKNEINKLNEEKEEAKINKKNAENEIIKLQEENNKLQEENGNIDEQIQKLEEEISKIKNDELQTAKAKYEDDKTIYENEKKEQVKNIQREIDKLTSELNRAKEQLTKVTKEEAQWKYNSNSGAQAVDWARQYDDMNQNQMSSVFREKGYAFHEGLWCADFVAMVLGEGIGYENLPSWYSNISNKAYCPNIQNAGKDYKISAEEAQTGDIVLFDWDNDGRANHVGLFVDNGDGSTTIRVIEGNTGNETIGSYSAVEEKERSRSTVLGIYSIHQKGAA